MKKLLTLFLIITVSMSVFAGDPARKGTSGAEQLLIPVGARSIATGQAFISHFSGIESIYYNPAGLDREGGTQAMFNYMNYIADIDLTYFAVSAQLEIGSIGLTYKTLNFGDIPVTTVENPDGTGQMYSPDYFVIGLTYSKMITDRVSAGVNFNFIHEGILNTSANGFAIDFGVQYRFTPNFSLGASVKNIGSNMDYNGEDLKTKTEVPGSALGSGSTVYEIDTEGFSIPSYFELSLAYTNEFNESNSLSLGGVFRNNNTLEDAARVGLEYNFNDNFFLRGGYDFALENQDQQIFGFTAGAGISYDFAQDMGLAFDYAFRDVKEFPTANHIFTLVLRVY